MKFLNISLLFFACIVLVCLLNTNAVAANDAAASKGAAATPRRPVGKSGKSTTSAPPEYDNEYPDGENIDQYDEGEETARSSTTTTTETPKKIGPVIRPFRSNDDFLNSLKRRQMDAKKHRAEKVAARSKPVEHHNNNDTEEPESAPAPAPVAAKSSKPSLPTANRNRKFSKPGKPQEQQEDTDAEGSEPQQEKQEEKLKRPHPRLALRKRA